MNDCDETPTLGHRLNDGKNVFALDLHPLTWFDLRLAYEKWRHLVSSKYMAGLYGDWSGRQVVLLLLYKQAAETPVKLNS